LIKLAYLEDRMWLPAAEGWQFKIQCVPLTALLLEVVLVKQLFISAA